MSPEKLKAMRELLDRADDHCEICCGDDPPWGEIRAVMAALDDLLIESGYPRLTPRVGSKEWLDAH